MTRARETHRHDVHVGMEYADDEIPSPFAELLTRERRSDAPVGILDGLLAKPRRDPAPPEPLCAWCGKPASQCVYGGR